MLTKSAISPSLSCSDFVTDEAFFYNLNPLPYGVHGFRLALDPPLR